MCKFTLGIILLPTNTKTDQFEVLKPEKKGNKKKVDNWKKVIKLL